MINVFIITVIHLVTSLPVNGNVDAELSLKSTTNTTAVLYAPDSGVVELTNDTFERDVIREDGGLWVVNFYASRCRFSRNFTSEYSKAAKALKGFAKVGAFNCEQVNAITYCGEVYPNVIIFVDNVPIRKFEGHPSAVDVINMIVEIVRSTVTVRLHNWYKLPSNLTIYTDPITTDSSTSDPVTVDLATANPVTTNPVTTSSLTIDPTNTRHPVVTLHSELLSKHHGSRLGSFQIVVKSIITLNDKFQISKLLLLLLVLLLL